MRRLPWAGNAPGEVREMPWGRAPGEGSWQSPPQGAGVGLVVATAMFSFSRSWAEGRALLVCGHPGLP